MKEKVIKVDLTTGSITIKKAGPDERLLGGRALTSKIISEEVNPNCHPLSKDNILVFAPGLVSGTLLSSSNRLSAGAKSPLTGGIKESNCGGLAGYKMARLGIKALKLCGRNSDGHPVGLKIDQTGAGIEDLSDIARCNIYESAAKLLERFGKHVGLIIAGPAGEMNMNAACLSVNDPGGEPCRNFGRGGLGAVMGSKNVKAVIIDDGGVKNAAPGDPGIKEIIKEFAELIKENPVTGKNFSTYGTAMTLGAVNSLGGLPTKNFSQGRYEQADKINGQALHDTLEKRGGVHGHACMPGCLIKCSNKYVDEDGQAIVGSVDYETICLLGSNLDLADLDQITELNRLCNEYGVDTIETGAALGVLSEAGIWELGNFQQAKALIQEIGKGSLLGKLLGSGAGCCGKVFGLERIPVVKNQSMGAYDPRAIKGMGVTYSFSTMGADHTAGNAITLAIDHLARKGQVAAVRELMINTVILDWLGLCIFTGRVSLANPDILEKIVRTIKNVDLRQKDMVATARKTIRLERAFNEAAGLGAAHDKLPEYFKTEKLAPQDSVFDIEEAEMNEFYNF